jgi:hypothetical protein
MPTPSKRFINGKDANQLRPLTVVRLITFDPTGPNSLKNEYLVSGTCEITHHTVFLSLETGSSFSFDENESHDVYMEIIGYQTPRGIIHTDAQSRILNDNRYDVLINKWKSDNDTCYIPYSPDGFPISLDTTYPTIPDADEALKTWINKFESQGYYSAIDADGTRCRIAFNHIYQFCGIRSERVIADE